MVKNGPLRSKTENYGKKQSIMIEEEKSVTVKIGQLGSKMINYVQKRSITIENG